VHLSTTASADPLDDAGFALLIAPLGPFEPAPRLVVAVSGGPDSMALCLLADRWLRPRGGSLTALTVDHGLRREASEEARRVGHWLSARGIAHEVLTWHGPKPRTGIQAAARAARYALLTGWCRDAGVLHLLLGHHLDDQAETVALRQARGSGPDGLAGMAAVREVEGLRLLRPLLGVPRSRLAATLEAAGQDWIEDPSNLAPGFARTRLREVPLDRDALVATAASMGRQRAALERRVAAFLVGAARIDPAGFVRLSRGALRAAPPELAERALQAALCTVAGAPYPPRTQRLARLLDALRGPDRWRGRTLCGCRILGAGDDLLICREPAAIAGPITVWGGVSQRWDDRFVVRVEGPTGLVLRALGADGWRQRHALSAPAGARTLPVAVGHGLPSLWRDGRLLAVPHLGLVDLAHEDLMRRLGLEFRPPRPLAGAPFGVTGTPDDG